MSKGKVTVNILGFKGGVLSVKIPYPDSVRGKHERRAFADGAAALSAKIMDEIQPEGDELGPDKAD